MNKFVIFYCLAFLIASILAQAPTVLNPGVATEANLFTQRYAYYSLQVKYGSEEESRDVDVFSTPVRCDGYVAIYASFNNKNPTKENHDYVSATADVSQVVRLRIDNSPQGTLYVGLLFTPLEGVASTQSCYTYLNSDVDHYQTLVRVPSGIPQWASYDTTGEEHEYFQIYVNGTNFKKGNYVGVVVTGLNEEDETEDQLTVYASNDNSRPTPFQYQWGGLSVRDGAFLSILGSDQSFKPESNYWLGVNSQSSIRPLPYTVAFVENGPLAQPLLLLNDQIQLGYSFTKSYSYFYLYVDQGAPTIHLRLHNELGRNIIYASQSDNRPSKQNYQWKGVDITIQPQAGRFLYIGVEALDAPLGVFFIKATRQ